jgi:dephospho-CoA kinase
MLRVGLTGNIASGKSSVARVWARHGARIIDADQLARRAVEAGSPGLERVVATFGAGVLDPAGALDRAALRELVFRDPAARARLEAIVHPEVARLRAEEEARAAAAGVEIVVNDIPLLFEVGLEGEFDLVVLVDAPEEVRRARLVRERGLDEGAARRMIEAQLPAAAKRERADYLIENEGTLPELEARAEVVWRIIRGRAAASVRRDPPALEAED